MCMRFFFRCEWDFFFGVSGIFFGVGGILCVRVGFLFKCG